MKTEDQKYLPGLRMSDFTYVLPQELVPFFPVHPRHASRLLHYQNGKIEHRKFIDLPEILNSGDILLLNDTRVIPARLNFNLDTGSKVEILLLRPGNTDLSVWEVLAGNRRKFRDGDVLSGPEFQEGSRRGHLEVRWHNRAADMVDLIAAGDFSIHELIELQGKMPLPPYIKRQAQDSDKTDYQTVFAKNEGAVAAPTASLHFTNEVLGQLKSNGILTRNLTLHVGMGTFKPVKSETADQHEMHAEQFVISDNLLKSIEERKGRLIPVGTTSMRVLESLYYIGALSALGKEEPEKVPANAGFHPELNSVSWEDSWRALKNRVAKNGGTLSGETSIFIMPGFKMRLTDGLITNFHQPGSTLLLLVSALVGESWTDIYRSALDARYRFLSYGDSSILFPLKVEKMQ